jgi:hypothetical protein
MTLSRNLLAEMRERWKNSLNPAYRPAPSWTQIHNATALQAVQINGHVVTWSNVVPWLAWINVNKTWIQMSVKQIRLYIKAKRKTHDNHSHKEHSTHFPHSHTLFVNLPQMLTLTKLPHSNIEPHAHWRMWKEENVIRITSNISVVQQFVLNC